MYDFRELQSVTFIQYPTGEISLRLDGSSVDGDDCLTVPVVARDDGGVYFLRADSDRIAEFFAKREPVPVPGGRV